MDAITDVVAMTRTTTTVRDPVVKVMAMTRTTDQPEHEEPHEERSDESYEL
ncbi:MAG: hypothetical protein ACMXYM_01885 [Candidatus Woesearchaeota archaeon]